MPVGNGERDGAAWNHEKRSTDDRNILLGPVAQLLAALSDLFNWWGR